MRIFLSSSISSLSFTSCICTVQESCCYVCLSSVQCNSRKQKQQWYVREIMTILTRHSAYVHTCVHTVCIVSTYVRTYVFSCVVLMVRAVLCAYICTTYNLQCSVVRSIWWRSLVCCTDVALYYTRHFCGRFEAASVAVVFYYPSQSEATTCAPERPPAEHDYQQLQSESTC